MADDAEIKLREACEAALWTHLGRNNPDLSLTEPMLAQMVDMLVAAGAYLSNGEIRLPLEGTGGE